MEETSRGFLRGGFVDRYGNKCSIQESSLATEAAIWLGVSDPTPKVLVPGRGWQEVPLPPETYISSRMHLTQDMVAGLIPLLQHFVDTGELPR
jgi:hypothetical protein